MSGSATQNPANKVGRNSGAGPSGISEISPTPQETARGLRPLRSEGGPGWSRYGAGVGALVAVGMAAVAYGAHRRRHRGLSGAVRRLRHRF